jgi:hypothetical protein
VFSVLYSRLLSKNLKINVVRYGCETWFLKTREEHRLRAFWEQGAEENIWTQEGGSDGRLEKTA